MNNNGFEIERKYLIRYPNLTILGRNAEATDIVQTYLLCPEPGSSERVRKRGADGEYVYTHTMKTRVSNMRRVEIENEISEREYNEYLRFADLLPAPLADDFRVTDHRAVQGLAHLQEMAALSGMQLRLD